jgi:ABC-2 type transport system ATP-binding protein
MQAIETVGLTRRFRRVDAVHDLNLQVPAGAVYALMGPNGAGKTTLIKLLMNLIQPSAGRAWLLGGDASRLSGGALEAIGYVSENQKLPDWFTAGAFLSYWRPFYPTWDITLEHRLVKRFELPLKQKLKHLSRGVRMKAALASVLAYRPKLIVLDEPLSGLDPLVRNDLMEVLLDLARETTIFISSHDLAEIDNFASHVGYMDGGKLRLSDSMTQVRERFRNVTFSSEVQLTLPTSLPSEWLQFACDGTTARWSETEYEPQASAARVSAAFGAATIQTTPMTLREVFLIMAKISRSTDGKASGI